jgi:hypothetical protein
VIAFLICLVTQTAERSVFATMTYFIELSVKTLTSPSLYRMTIHAMSWSDSLETIFGFGVTKGATLKEIIYKLWISQCVFGGVLDVRQTVRH